MDPHGIDIFNGADHQGVVGPITHHFELKFFPAHEGFLNQHFADGAGSERIGRFLGILLTVVDQ